MKEEFTKEEDRQKARFYFIEEALNAHENIRQRSFTLKNEESFKVLKENEKKMMRIQR